MAGASSKSSISRRIGHLAWLLCLVGVALTATLLWHRSHVYAEARKARSEFEIFRATLLVMEKVSAERGPTNGMLGEALPTPEPVLNAVREARQASDQAVQSLAGLLASTACPACAEGLAEVDRAALELALARAYIDTFVRLPIEERGAPELDAAIGRMVAIIPRFTPVVDAGRIGIVRGSADVLDYLHMARLAAELREQAGLLGSRFTGSLGSRHALSAKAQYAIERSLGKVEELRSLIESSAQASPADVKRVLARMHGRYFDEGLAYVEQVREQVGLTPWAAPSTGEFAARYVPLMAPIVDFRDQMLDRTEAQLAQHSRIAGAELAGTALGAAAVMGLLWLLVRLLRGHLLRPLSEATRQIMAISDGRLERKVSSRVYRGEIQALFDAVRMLQANSVERARLESERDRLIGELTSMAQTDALTGLLNRRAFESRAQLACSATASGQSYVFLVVFDIDYFKRINDNYGHAIGDDALRKVADLCREVWHQGELVARMGGDEFVVLIETPYSGHALATIEHFRERLAQTLLDDGRGGQLTMTSSIGVAHAYCADTQAETPNMWALFARADALLYRAKEGGRNRMEIEPIDAAPWGKLSA